MDEFSIDLSKAQPIPKDSAKKYVFILIIFIFSSIVAAVTIFSVIFFARNQEKDKPILPFKPVSPTPTKAKSREKKQVIGFLPHWISTTNIQIDVTLLSQVILFSLSIDPNGNIIKTNKDGTAAAGWTQLSSPLLSQLQKEASASGTKILVAINNFSSREIESIISNKTNTQNLISQVIEVLRTFRLDGVNINFEYFADSSFSAVREMNAFLQDLVLALKKENDRYIVSFDVNALSVLVDANYDMARIGQLTDQVILMGYDYYRASSRTAGPVAPLFAGEGEHSVGKSVQTLIGRVPKEKIVLALPFFGYEWQTSDAKYKSQAVENTGSVATYERVQDLINNRKDISLNRDEASFSPWLVYRQSGVIKQIYYEDEVSLGKKLDFVKQKELGGIAIWALGFEGKYSQLWKAIKSNLP